MPRIKDRPQAEPRKKNPAAVALGKLGQASYMEKVSAQRRSELARHAADARWKKFRQQKRKKKS